MEDWPLIESLIHHLHVNLSVPIMAKFRVYDDVEKSVAYAKMLESAGAQVITVHGRTREQKGQNTGRADWYAKPLLAEDFPRLIEIRSKIKAIRSAVSAIPVIANGNLLISQDVTDCLAYTGCDGVMSAEGNLYNPALFDPLNPGFGSRFEKGLPVALRDKLKAVPAPRCDQVRLKDYPPSVWLARRYLAIVTSLKTQTATSAIRSHLFKLFRPMFESGILVDFRTSLGDHPTSGWQQTIDWFVSWVEQVDAALLVGVPHPVSDCVSEPMM